MNTHIGAAEDQVRSEPMKNHPPEDSAAARIKELIQQFRVCWSVWPEVAFVKGEKRKVGFNIDLCGTHQPGTLHVGPGCEHCRPVQAALKEIANWILPREERPSMYEISMDTQALEYSPAHGNRPDVTLTIRIVHRGNLEQPIDECEATCLQEMEQSLKDLGASKGRWVSHTSAAPQE